MLLAACDARLFGSDVVFVEKVSDPILLFLISTRKYRNKIITCFLSSSKETIIEGALGLDWSLPKYYTKPSYERIDAAWLERRMEKLI
jgi:hypothetical protein